jgi:hypothetical protein
MSSLELEDELFIAVDDYNALRCIALNRGSNLHSAYQSTGCFSQRLTVQLQLLRHQRCTRAVIENASLDAKDYRHPALGIGM